MGESSEMEVCKHCGDVIMYCKCYEDVIKSIESEKKNLLERAIELAVKHHKGQTDKAGKAYILHPLRLMMAVNTDEEKIVAVLHDIVEDTDITLEDLRNEGFSNAIVDAIECVTKIDDEDYDAFIKRISKNPLAVKVKLADLEDNMDLSRLPKVTDKDLERVEKYKQAKAILVKGI